MKKVIYVICLMFISVISIENVHAASGSISVSSSSKTAVVGSTFTVNVKVSCSDTLGSWQYGLTYDSAYISLQSGDVNIADVGDGKIKSKTFTYKFKAIKSGNAGIRISGAAMTDWSSGTLFTPSISNASVTVKTQAEIEASYSKDNNLKSLTVDGYKLSPDFSKDTLEYSIEVPDDVTSIDVTAKANDGTATVRGTGSIDVSEGSNKVEVVVTAQNGSTKSYVINVTVKDLTPIDIKLNGKNYSVVKKDSLLTCPIGYTSTTIKINGIEVPAFSSEISKFTLVGLKDEVGNVDLYIYDSSNNTYELYNEIKSSSMSLYPIKTDEELSRFTKTTIMINDVEYEAYKMNNIILIHAMNVENGKTGFYQYDKEENSFIKYDANIYEALYNRKEEFKIYILGLCAIAALLFLICLIQAHKNRNLKKLILKVSDKQKITEEKQEKK